MSGMYPQLYAYLAGEVDDALPDMDRMMESRIVDWQQIMKLYEKLKNALLTCEERYIEAEEAPGKAAAGAENILQFQGDRRIMQIEQRTTLRGTGPRDNKRNRERKNPMKHRRLVTLALVVVLVSGMIVWAGAANTLQEIKAYLNYGVTVKYEGEAQKFYDANGKQVYPITYEGTTYLPLRSIGNLLGVNVDWDGATKTVQVGQAAGLDLIDDIGLYAHVNAEQHQTSEGKTRDIGGNTVSHWVQFGTGGIYAEAHFNLAKLEGKYSTLTFQVFAGSSSQTGDTTMTVYGDNGEVLKEVTVTSNAVPQTITVPLNNATELFFKAKPDYRYNMFVFDAHLS